jgi:hypothetical protein
MQFQVGKTYKASFVGALDELREREGVLQHRVRARATAYQQITGLVRVQDDVIAGMERDLVQWADAVQSTHDIPDVVTGKERDDCVARLQSAYGGAMVRAGLALFQTTLPEGLNGELLLGFFPDGSKNALKQARCSALYDAWRPADEDDWRVVLFRELIVDARAVPAVVAAKYNKVKRIQDKFRAELLRQTKATEHDLVEARQRLKVLKGKRRHHSLKEWEREVLAIMDGDQERMVAVKKPVAEQPKPKGNVARVAKPVPEVPSVSMRKPGLAQPEDILTLFVEGCSNARMSIQPERCTIARNKKRVWVVKAFDAVGNPFDFHMTKGYQAKLDRMAATRQ